MDIVIRRAALDDATALSLLGERTFREAFGAMNRPEDTDAYCRKSFGEPQQREEIAIPEGVTLVAESGGRLIAFAQVRRAPSPWGDVELARFYVDQPWHGKGLAQKLMREVEVAARSLGAGTLWLSVWERNPRAIAFYAKAGFRDAGTQPFVVGSDVQTDRILTRVIPPA